MTEPPPLTGPPTIKLLLERRNSLPSEIKRILKSLRKCNLDIRVESSQPDWMQQEMLRHAVRLAVRVFPNVSVTAPKLLHTLAETEAETIGFPLQAKEATHILAIGPSSEATCSIDASNWLIHAASGRLPDLQLRVPHPVTPLLAAAAGVSGLLRTAIGENWDPQPVTSIWDGVADGPVIRNIDCDGWAFLGTGSIGSTAIDLLTQWESVSGQVTLVDNDKFEEKNHARYSSLHSSDLGQFKVDVLKRRLGKHGNLRTTASSLTMQNWVQQLDAGTRIPFALVALDTQEARAHAGDAMPQRGGAATVNGEEARAVMCDYLDGPCTFCQFSSKDPTIGLAEQLAKLTGLNPDRVKELVSYGPPDAKQLLQEADLKTIAARWRIESSGLAEFRHRRLLDMRDALVRLEYSSFKIGKAKPNSGARITVPMPSAAAGALLLSAALRPPPAHGEPNDFRYWPASNTIKVGIVGKPEGGLCLCQDNKRREFYQQLYAGK